MEKVHALSLWFFVAVGGCSGDDVAATPNTSPHTAPAAHTGCPTLRLTFAINKDYDAHTIYTILQGMDPAGLRSRASSMGVSRQLAEAIHSATGYAQVAGAIASVVDSRYARLGRDLARARGAYEGAWPPSLQQMLSERVSSLTDHCCVRSRYKVVVSAFPPGLSSWHGAVVAAKFDYDVLGGRSVAP